MLIVGSHIFQKILKIDERVMEMLIFEARIFQIILENRRVGYGNVDIGVPYLAKNPEM